MRICWSQILLLAVAAALAILSLLANTGCGQKGDLYLPNQAPPAQEQPQ